MTTQIRGLRESAARLAALLWALHDPARLAPGARAAISDARRAVYFSAASAWELEIKAAKGKLTLPDQLARCGAGDGVSGTARDGQRCTTECAPAVASQ